MRQENFLENYKYDPVEKCAHRVVVGKCGDKVFYPHEFMPFEPFFCRCNYAACIKLCNICIPSNYKYIHIS